MDKTFDIGILTVFDATPIENDKIKEQAEQSVVQLYQKLWQIKQDRDLINNEKKEEFQMHDFERGDYEIDLPEMEFNFPRQKPLPKEKQLTKWEKFAKEKGIKKKPKHFKQFDEDLGEYLPRYGAKSAKKIKEKQNWLMEVKQGEDPYDDPFKRAALKKKLAKEQEKMKEVQNKLNQQGLYGRGVLNDQVEHKKPTRKQKTKNLKQQTKRDLSVAQQSTRSMGAFDQKAHKDEKKQKVKKRKEHVSFKSNKEEQRRDMDMLNFVMNKKVKA